MYTMYIQRTYNGTIYIYIQCLDNVYSMYCILNVQYSPYIHIHTHCIYNTLLHHEIRSAFPMFELRPLFSAVLAMLYWPVWC